MESDSPKRNKQKPFGFELSSSAVSVAGDGSRLRRLLFAMPPDPAHCQTFCDPACAYYRLCSLPLPPPPILCPPSAGSDRPPISTIVLHPRHHSSLLPALPIAAGSILVFAFVLFVAFCLHLLILRRRRLRRTAAVLAASGGGGTGNDFFDGVEVDHHIWSIRTVGLDESTIGAITAWAYKADNCAAAAVGDCAVCLAEFRDGEVLRRLPKCGHAFHLECIDTWLRSHVNCPLCRAAVVGGEQQNEDSGPSSLGSSPSSSLSEASDPVNPNPRSLVSISNSANWPSESTREVSGVRELPMLEIEPQNGILINPIPGTQHFSEN